MYFSLLILASASLVLSQTNDTTSTMLKPTSVSTISTRATESVPEMITATGSSPKMTASTPAFSSDNTPTNVNCVVRDPYSCSRHGICIDLSNPGNFTCQCEPRFLGNACEIEQKSRVVAFLIELSFGHFGAGDFYLGRTDAGIVRLIIMLLLCCLSCSAAILKKKSDTMCSLFLAIAACIITVLMIIWWIVDLVLISDGTYYGNGVPTYNDM